MEEEEDRSDFIPIPSSPISPPKRDPPPPLQRMEDESNSSGTDSNGDRKVIKSEVRLRIGGGEASLVKVLIAKRAAMMDPGSILFDFARMEGED